MTDAEADRLAQVMHEHRERDGQCADGCGRFPCTIYARANAELRVAGRLPREHDWPPLAL